jgi:UDP-glucose 4-epimerase
VIPCCVIGGTGFIGSHLVEILVARERQVTVIGKRSRPSRELPEGVRYIAGDYGSKDFLRNALEGMKEVVDLAYSTVPQTSFENPVNDITSNLPAAVNLFEVASSLDLNRLILVSSGGVIYGEPSCLPISEDHPTNPISPYGITKLAVEKYALMFHRTRSLPVICVRPSNAFGERQKPFVGQGFIATAMASILKNQEIVIYGSEGTIRDYIYVTDIVNGIFSLLEDGTVGTCYNIGTGIGKSNRDVLDALSSLTEGVGLETKIKLLQPRGYDVSANILESTKLINETGWKPNVPFEAGIERTWRWFCSRKSSSWV